MECNKCNNIFRCKSSLIKHQKSAKYCSKGEKQESLTVYLCEFCNKLLSSKRGLHSHTEICIEKFKQDLLEKDKIISDLTSLKIENISLKAELKVYKKISESSTKCVEEIAKQLPTIQKY